MLFCDRCLLLAVSTSSSLLLLLSTTRLVTVEIEDTKVNNKMGQLLSFCSDPDESKKPKALSEPPPQQDDEIVDEIVEDMSSVDANDKDSERLLREEQARLELIVSTAGRDMVAVRSTRANPAYYDQGFAAALAQHLNEKIGSSSALPNSLPPSNVTDVYATLNKSPHVQFDTRENLNTYMDLVAESLLASLVPTKEHLFSGVGPMVENLL